VATDTIARADRRPAEFGALFRFHEVFQKEIALINQRRARDPRGEIQLQIEALEDISGEPVFPPLKKRTSSASRYRAAVFALLPSASACSRHCM
jgi:hypothetical protein